jgi:hypothetical protein
MRYELSSMSWHQAGALKNTARKKGGKCEMNPSREEYKNRKTEIVTQIAELSRLLGMIPSDDTIELHEPMTHHNMVLSDWLGAARDSFLKLSLLISQELDIQLQ